VTWFGDAALLRRCPNLLAISSTGAGYDMIDVEDCTAAGVIVVNQSGTNKEGVAEHALGLILTLSKKIAVSERAMRTVQDMDRRGYAGNDIRHKTLGIIGIGNIGTRLAGICRVAFDMTVLAYDPYLTAEQIAARGGTKVELEELLRRSDYVTVHCPRTAITANSQQVYHAHLADHLTPLNQPFQALLGHHEQTLRGLGYAADTAHSLALGLINHTLNLQAAVLAYSNVFALSAAAAFFVVPLTFLFRAGVAGRPSR